MTTLVVQLSPTVAAKLAAAADRHGLTHDELAREALRVFLSAEAKDAARPKPRRAVR